MRKNLSTALRAFPAAQSALREFILTERTGTSPRRGGRHPAHASHPSSQPRTARAPPPITMPVDKRMAAQAGFAGMYGLQIGVSPKTASKTCVKSARARASAVPPPAALVR